MDEIKEIDNIRFEFEIYKRKLKNHTSFTFWVINNLPLWFLIVMYFLIGILLGAFIAFMAFSDVFQISIKEKNNYQEFIKSFNLYYVDTFGYRKQINSISDRYMLFTAFMLHLTPLIVFMLAISFLIPIGGANFIMKNYKYWDNEQKRSTISQNIFFLNTIIQLFFGFFLFSIEQIYVREFFGNIISNTSGIYYAALNFINGYIFITIIFSFFLTYFLINLTEAKLFRIVLILILLIALKVLDYFYIRHFNASIILNFGVFTDTFFIIMIGLLLFVLFSFFDSISFTKISFKKNYILLNYLGQILKGSLFLPGIFIGISLSLNYLTYIIGNLKTNKVSDYWYFTNEINPIMTMQSNIINLNHLFVFFVSIIFICSIGSLMANMLANYFQERKLFKDLKIILAQNILADYVAISLSFVSLFFLLKSNNMLEVNNINFLAFFFMLIYIFLLFLKWWICLIISKFEFRYALIHLLLSMLIGDFIGPTVVALAIRFSFDSTSNNIISMSFIIICVLNVLAIIWILILCIPILTKMNKVHSFNNNIDPNFVYDFKYVKYENLMCKYDVNVKKIENDYKIKVENISKAFDKNWLKSEYDKNVLYLKIKTQLKYYKYNFRNYNLHETEINVRMLNVKKEEYKFIKLLEKYVKIRWQYQNEIRDNKKLTFMQIKEKFLIKIKKIDLFKDLDNLDDEIPTFFIKGNFI